MTSPNASGAVMMTAPASIELHYFPKADIRTGRTSVALCGAPGTPTTATSAQSGRVVTSYTCPDCMLRYSLMLSRD